MKLRELQESFMSEERAKSFCYLGERLKVLRKLEKKGDFITTNSFSDGEVKCALGKFGNMDILLKKEFIVILNERIGFDLATFFKLILTFSYEFGLLVLSCAKIEDNEKNLHIYLLDRNGVLRKKFHLNNLAEFFNKNELLEVK